MMSVFYEELAPKEFKERMDACPVGYLPLGTIEWHGPHNPLGVDMLESKALFALAAERFGASFSRLFSWDLTAGWRRTERNISEWMFISISSDARLIRCSSFPEAVTGCRTRPIV